MIINMRIPPIQTTLNKQTRQKETEKRNGHEQKTKQNKTTLLSKCSQLTNRGDG